MAETIVAEEEIVSKTRQHFWSYTNVGLTRVFEVVNIRRGAKKCWTPQYETRWCLLFLGPMLATEKASINVIIA